METVELYSSEIPRRCDECTSSLKTLMKSHSILEEVQMASEAWLDDAYFSGVPSHHFQPVTSATETRPWSWAPSGAARLHPG